MGSGYFAIHSLRKFIFAINLVAFNSYPKLNCVVMMMISAFLIYNSIKHKPHRDKLFSIRDEVSELCFIAIFMISMFVQQNSKSI